MVPNKQYTFPLLMQLVVLIILKPVVTVIVGVMVTTVFALIRVCSPVIILDHPSVVCSVLARHCVCL